MPTGASPYGMAFDRDGKRLFVVAARAKALEALDAKTFAKIAAVPIGERCWHFTFTPDYGRILVACGRSHEVRVIDAERYTTLEVLGGFKLPWGGYLPQGLRQPRCPLSGSGAVDPEPTGREL
ncbi:MAG: YncE family protein [Gammaproteobacteria bacterium]